MTHAPITIDTSADPGSPAATPATGTRLWPASTDAAAWPVLAAAAVAYVVAAVTGPDRVVGVAGIMTGIAVVAVPAVVVATSRPAARRLVRPLPLLAASAALALLAVGTLRAAGWLYVLCVLTALWLVSYTVAAGRRWPSVFLGGGGAWVGIARGRRWLTAGIWSTLDSARTAMSSTDKTHRAHAGQTNDGEPGRPSAILCASSRERSACSRW